MNCLVAHCPTLGCLFRVPIGTIATDKTPEFDATVQVVVTCPSCGKEFRELASELEFTPQAEITGKFISRRKPVHL